MRLKLIGDAVVAAVKAYVSRETALLSAKLNDLAAYVGDLEKAAKIPGPKGDKGDPGESIKGDKGDKGDPGESIKGDKGDPGESIKGDKGDKGDPGESIKGDKGEPGESVKGDKGDKGDPGESIKGDKGEKGDPGESIHPDTISLMVREMVEKAVAAIPKAKDGENGRDAPQIHILPEIDLTRSYPFGTWAKHKGGVWMARSTTHALDGWDCIVDGLDAVDVDVDEDARNFTVSVKQSSGATKEKRFSLHTVQYREVWKEGKEYQRGDLVTWAGSVFHCQRDTTDKPETSDAWKLAVKRGRDGK